jgi:hypothetical protein
MSNVTPTGDYYVSRGPSEKQIMFCLFQDTDGTTGSLFRGDLVSFRVVHDEFSRSDGLKIPKDDGEHWVTCAVLGVERETFHAHPGNVFHLKCRIVRVDSKTYDPNDAPWCSVFFRIHNRTGRMYVFQGNPNPVYKE